MIYLTMVIDMLNIDYLTSILLVNLPFNNERSRKTIDN